MRLELVSNGKPDPLINSDNFEAEILAEDAWLKATVGIPSPDGLLTYDGERGTILPPL